MNTAKIRLLVCIPCYNEQDAIVTTIKQVEQSIAQMPAIKADLLVVNDGSTDKSLENIRSTSATVLNLPINLGIGGAIQTGFLYAHKKGYDIMIQVDGDGQHDASYIPQVVVPVINKLCDVCIGSRFIQKKGFQSSAIRQVGIRWFSILLRILTGLKILDTTSGFRAFNAQAIELSVKEYPDHYPEPEILISYALHKLKVLEVPVVMRQRAYGRSSIGIMDSFFYVFSVTLGIIFRYIREFKNK